MSLKHKFVEFIPDQLEQGTLYVSIEYGTVVHTCCCGCGEEVVTPLSPTDWKLVYDGATISLYPSIGNWSFRCESHYWITENQVRWAPKISDQHLKRIRTADRARKNHQYAEDRPLNPSAEGLTIGENEPEDK